MDVSPKKKKSLVKGVGIVTRHVKAKRQGETSGIKKEESFILNQSGKCLIVEPEDWHTMDCFTQGATLLVFASEYYDVDDYIDDEY